MDIFDISASQYIQITHQFQLCCLHFEISQMEEAQFLHNTPITIFSTPNIDDFAAVFFQKRRYIT